MIPALGEQDAAAEAQEAVSSRVLVLDEAAPVRAALSDILRKLGVADADVEHATTAEEALAAFSREVPHIVFMELVGIHPEDGLEIVHEMLDRAPQVKIVLVTAEPRDSAEVRAAVRAGVFALVEKPLRHEKIRQVMQELASEEGGVERMR